MPELTLEQAFQAALQHHRSGQLAHAEQLYRQILVYRPDHAEALHFLGVIAAQAGRNDDAVDLMRQSIALKPNWPQSYNNLGTALRACGRLEDAITAFRKAVEIKPDFAEAYIHLGDVLTEAGRLEEAIAACRVAIDLKPNDASAHFNLGNALKAAGQFEPAISAYERAISLDGKFPPAHINLGVALRAIGQVDAAIAAYRAAVALDPNNALAHNNMGNALVEQKNPDGAIAAYRQAISLQPNYADAHNNLGNALKDKGQFDEAIAAYQQAIALRPDHAEAYCNLGVSLQAQGQFDEAITAYRRAISLKPDNSETHYNLAVARHARNELDQAVAAYHDAIAPKLDRKLVQSGASADAHRNLALALLALGNFQQGWAEYEWRWKCKDFAPARRDFPQPQWDGRPLDGATLLLHAEQGLGDTIQFIRYLPLVARMGGKIVIECQSELLRLLQPIAADASVVAHGQTLPAFDMHCPLLSLPHVLGTTLETIPRDVPYLFADAESARTWKERLAKLPHSLKVGLAWAGSKIHTNDRNRSMSLSEFAALAGTAGITFLSLQKGTVAEQLKSPPEGLQILDWTPELHDFADTAAFVANLDLVITVDTAIAHLAGAMGRPAWVLLPFAPDWRWLLAREDSPWYPTLRLFRQPRPGDWQSVIRAVSAALTAYPAPTA